MYVTAVKAMPIGMDFLYSQLFSDVNKKNLEKNWYH